MEQMSRSKITFVNQRRVVIVVLLALLATACGASNNTPTTDAVTVDSTVPEALSFDDSDRSIATEPARTVIQVAARSSLEASAVWIAESEGFYAKHGISIEFVPVAYEGAVVTALNRNDAEIGVLSSTAALGDLGVIDLEAFEPLVYLSGTDTRSESGRGNISLVVPSSSEIARGCDLEGKVIAVDGLQTAGAIAVKEMIIQDGCNPTLATLSYETGDATLRGLRSGEIDAAATVDPLTAQLLRGQNVVRENLDGQLCPDYGQCPLSIVFVDSNWASGNAETVRDFRRATHEAISWIRVNQIQYMAALSRCCAVDVDDASQSLVPNLVGDRRNLDSDLDRLQDIVAEQLEVIAAIEAEQTEDPVQTDEE